MRWIKSFFRIGSEPVLSATIRIEPDGRPSVSFNPTDAPSDNLMRPSVLYAAKIRWVLESESPAVTEVYETLFSKILEHWPQIEAMTRTLQSDLGLGAAGKGESYTIRLVIPETSEPYIVNSLASPGLAVNVPLSTLLLLGAVCSRLPEREGMVLGEALAKLREVLFVEPIRSSFSGLRHLNTEVNVILTSALAEHRP